MRLSPVAFSLMFFLSVFVSCQKEESFEVGSPGIGSLRSDGNGDCLPKTAVGSFISGSALSDSNYLEIEIDVSQEGIYTISTDTVNGYSFSGTGSFAQTGINRIRLAGSGTPQSPGDDVFTVLYDTSFCFVPVTVLPEGSSGPSTFTLQGQGDSCIVAAVSGDYVQNTPLGGSNTVEIKVNATTTGTYSVSTNDVNEFSFSGSGTISAIGEQSITLTASGTPATEGNTVFTIIAGGTTCSFSVNVTASDTPPPVNTGDLFPLTPGSKWSYLFDLSAPNDSIEVANIGTMELGGNTYQNFEFSALKVPFDSFYYRKSNNDYLQYVDLNELIPDLETETKGDILFLKENVTAGETWNTDFETKVGGTDVVIRFAFTCTEANQTATVNGKTFNGVYKITTTLQENSGGDFADFGPEIETYYARGIGLIYETGYINVFYPERHIKSYEIK